MMESGKQHSYIVTRWRRLAESVLRKGDALDVEVEISTETGYSETLSNLRPTVADLQ